MAKTGSSFTGWTLTADGSGTLYNSGDPILMGKKNITFYARWGYPLTVTIEGDGGVASDDSKIAVSGDGNSDTGMYNFSDSTNMTATPNPGSKFDTWSGDCSGTNNPLSILIDGTKTCTAKFVPLSLPVAYDGCFSDETTGKDLDTYKGILGSEYGLLQRVYDATKLLPSSRIEGRGYMLSDYTNREAQNRKLKTKLAANIAQYITSKYCATEISAVNGTNIVEISQNNQDGAIIQKTTGFCQAIPSGAQKSKEYYYYENTGTETLLTL